MILFKTLGWVALTCSLLQGQTPSDDPVVKARQQRAQSQGVNEGDLPPVPRTIIEPPPLPPPELHTRDMVHSSRTKARISRVSRRKGTSRGKVAKGRTRSANPQVKAAPKRARKRARR